MFLSPVIRITWNSPVLFLLQNKERQGLLAILRKNICNICIMAVSTGDFLSRGFYRNQRSRDPWLIPQPLLAALMPAACV